MFRAERSTALVPCGHILCRPARRRARSYASVCRAAVTSRLRLFHKRPRADAGASTTRCVIVARRGIVSRSHLGGGQQLADGVVCTLTRLAEARREHRRKTGFSRLCCSIICAAPEQSEHREDYPRRLLALLQDAAAAPKAKKKKKKKKKRGESPVPKCRPDLRDADASEAAAAPEGRHWRADADRQTPAVARTSPPPYTSPGFAANRGRNAAAAAAKRPRGRAEARPPIVLPDDALPKLGPSLPGRRSNRSIGTTPVFDAA